MEESEAKILLKGCTKCGGYITITVCYLEYRASRDSLLQGAIIAKCNSCESEFFASVDQERIISTAYSLLSEQLYDR